MTRSNPDRAYLSIGRWKVRVPKHKSARIALAVVMLIRGIIPTPTSPVLLTASITLLSIDVPALRRLRRRAIVAFGRRARRSSCGHSLSAKQDLTEDIFRRPSAQDSRE